MNRLVVFVCEHGAAKSPVAAAWLNRLADEAGMPLHAIARGTEPEPALSPIAASGLEADGITMAASGTLGAAMGKPPHVANRGLSPNRVVRLGRRVFGRLLRRAGVTAVLEVPGRRTGKPVRTTLAPWDIDGTRYLMSQYGLPDWVRNLRAAGRGQLHYKDRTEVFRAIEVEGEERDRVIGAFRAKADKLLNRDFDRLPYAPDHPTFRVSPIR